MLKPALSIAGLVLAASSLTACGDGGSPDDASTKDFCAGFSGLDDAMSEFDPTGKPEEAIKLLQTEVQKIVDTGTPKDISDDARDGFEVTTQTILDLDADSSLEELGKLDEKISDDEKDQADAFQDYLSETCED